MPARTGIARRRPRWRGSGRRRRTVGPGARRWPSPRCGGSALDGWSTTVRCGVPPSAPGPCRGRGAWSVPKRAGADFSFLILGYSSQGKAGGCPRGAGSPGSGPPARLPLDHIGPGGARRIAGCSRVGGLVAGAALCALLPVARVPCARARSARPPCAAGAVRVGG